MTTLLRPSVTMHAASPAHVGVIARNMREIDVREAAAFGHTPKEALRVGLRGSVVALTAKVDGIPHAMLGVVPGSVIEDRGIVWMLGTDEVLRHGRTLLAFAPRILGIFHSSFRELGNIVSVDNRRAIRLLRAWGFSVNGTVQLVRGVEFVPFRRFRDV